MIISEKIFLVSLMWIFFFYIAKYENSDRPNFWLEMYASYIPNR